MAKARLDKLYKETIRPELRKEMGDINIMEVPKLRKIVLNIGVSEAVQDSRVLKKVSDIIQNIAGQTPVRTQARDSIAGFKIREGMPIGIKVTLRKQPMYEFFDKLIYLALPKVKDFQGLKDAFDSRGSYNLGIKEWSIFPEAEKLSQEMSGGLNITIVTTAKKDEDARLLLKKFGMPFKRKQ